MTYKPTAQKVHFTKSAEDASGFVPCSGRSVLRAMVTTDPAEVTCGACLRKLRAEVRKVFDAAIAEHTDPDAIARLELAREYVTDPTFRAALEAFTYDINAAA